MRQTLVEIAGQISLCAPNITIRNKSNITTITQGEGRGGDITIEAGRLRLQRGAFIDSSTDGEGRGGK